MSSSSTAIRKTTVKGGGTSTHVTTSTGSTATTSKSTKGGKKKQQRGFISSNLLFVLLIGFILIWLGVYQYVFPSLMSSSNSNPHHSLLSSYDKIRHKNSDSKSSNSNPYHAGLSPMDWDKIRHNIHHDNVHHQKKERIDGGDHHKLLDHSHDHEQDLLSSKERKRHRQLPPKVATAEDTAVADTAIIQHNNPYEGWQPLIHNDSDGYSDKCKSWRTCFEKIHDCPGKCRDGLDDFGIPPIAPTGIDPYGDEEDNKEKKDAGGQWIPDVTVLRRMMIAGKDSNGNIWPPPLITETNRELCEDIGVFGGKIDDHKGLLNFGSKDSKYIRGLPLVFKDDDPRLVTKQPKILCMVYTMEQNHHTSIRAIRETWGGGCDGFLAFSTKDDPRIPAISLVHDGPEEYNNMWQKVRSIWRFVGKHYLDEFDFFFQGGEDLYVLPQNLRQYLASAVDDPTKDDFFGGRRFQQSQNIFFNSGGAGYALSQATLRKFTDTGLDHPKCFADKHTAMEDVMIARCLKDVFDIGLVDTRDAQDRERFHPFSPGSHYSWDYPIPPARDWYESYNRLWPIKLKEQCCAPDSVSFHYMKKPAMVRHLHSLLYFCD